VLPGAAAAGRVARLAGVQLSGWDAVATLGAYADSAYSVVVPTLADSNAGGPHYAVFFVRAATATPSLYFDSPPDSGYSLDNLAPETPAPFRGTFAAGATHLHWGPSAARDFSSFHLYRGRTVDFLPGPSNLIAATADTGYVDPVDSAFVYRLSAVDVNGNESGFALVIPAGVVPVPGGQLPTALWLGRAVPSPARGSARGEFGLPRAAGVSLDVVDVAGRVVRHLVQGTQGPGLHPYAWDLRDAGGRAVGAGIYFLRLEVEGAALTRRLVVVR
jgi:hypothetical protein